ncbi:MAG: mycofactocin biosynthesis chaperone MftB [Actinomycetota bacterium]
MRRLLIDRLAVLDQALELHPKVALRREPFGALAYHYDTRRLVFLKHPDVVRVVESLERHDSVADTLSACDIDPARWASFDRALTSLYESEMLHERATTG